MSKKKLFPLCLLLSLVRVSVGGGENPIWNEMPRRSVGLRIKPAFSARSFTNFRTSLSFLNGEWRRETPLEGSTSGKIVAIKVMKNR